MQINMLAYFFYPYCKLFLPLYKDLTFNIFTYSNITISLSVTNKISGMVSRTQAKRGEQTHTPQLCNGGTIMYIELVNPSLWRSS